MTGKALIALMLLCLLALPGCVSPSVTSVPTLVSPEFVKLLPTPILLGKKTLEETLVQRRSIRDYSDEPLTDAQLGQLLWAAQGITGERGFRTAPSAGALYPLEVYTASADGIYRYEPRGHRLVAVSRKDARQILFEAALRQEPVREAPTVFIVAGVYARTEEKYGTERGIRYVHMEAGHAAQNLLLEAVALGLGAVPIGAFQDEQVQEALGLPADHEPLYLIPVGRPRGAGS